jgi:hypothetical protein
MRTIATIPFALGFALLAGMFPTSDAQAIRPPTCANGLVPKCVRHTTTHHICLEWRCPVATVPRKPKVVEPKSTVPLKTAPKTTTKLK